MQSPLQIDPLAAALLPHPLSAAPAPVDETALSSLPAEGADYPNATRGGRVVRLFGVHCDLEKRPWFRGLGRAEVFIQLFADSEHLGEQFIDYSPVGANRELAPSARIQRLSDALVGRGLRGQALSHAHRARAIVAGHGLVAVAGAGLHPEQRTE
jgi:hypothetical protein